MSKQEGRKVVVVGAGAVGCSYIYAVMQNGLADEIILVDIDTSRVEGEVMDLNHGLAFTHNATIKGGTYADCAGADLVVVTAGAKQKPGESRLHLVEKNARIIESICDDIKKHTCDAVVLIVSNPCDILTHVAIERLQFPSGKVFGSGTVLDSARFRFMLSAHCNVDPRSVHAYILGEHGDSEIAAWSLCSIGGIPMAEYLPNGSEAVKDKILSDVRTSAYDIIERKGSTFYGIGLSLLRISQAVLRDERSVLTVSTLLKGECGQNNVCLSVPCVVGRKGAISVLAPKLKEDEQAGLQKSADNLREILSALKSKKSHV
ncbi:L-lactate dehydrogenase [Diplonema papillatum]|nr:L-lactate dehydrogenase [Diplonema papillatum]|eukprot:gene11693-18034_t